MTCVGQVIRAILYCKPTDHLSSESTELLLISWLLQRVFRAYRIETLPKFPSHGSILSLPRVTDRRQALEVFIIENAVVTNQKSRPVVLLKPFRQERAIIVGISIKDVFNFRGLGIISILQ